MPLSVAVGCAVSVVLTVIVSSSAGLRRTSARLLTASRPKSSRPSVAGNRTWDDSVPRFTRSFPDRGVACGWRAVIHRQRDSLTARVGDRDSDRGADQPVGLRAVGPHTTTGTGRRRPRPDPVRPVGSGDPAPRKVTMLDATISLVGNLLDKP